MNRLVKILALLWLVSIGTATAEAKNLYSNFAVGGASVVTSGVSSTSKALLVCPSTTVTVYSPDTTSTVSIYSDNSGTAKSNPFTANSDGSYSFYADTAPVDVRISGTCAGLTIPFTNRVSPIDDNRLPHSPPVVYPDGYSGDWGDKIEETIDNCPSIGCIIDARMLTGAQTLSATLPIDKSNVTILMGAMHLDMGTHQITLAQGIDGFHLEGQTASTYGSRGNSGTTLNYDGTGNNPAILIGDASAQTTDFRFENCRLNITQTTGAGIQATNLLQGRIRYNIILGATSTTMTTTGGVSLLGGSNSATTFGGFTIVDENEIGHFQYDVFLGDSSNANIIKDNNIHGYPTTGGLAGGGSMTYGVYLGANASNKLSSNDIEGMGTGIYFGAGSQWNTGGDNSFESIGTYSIDGTVGSSFNYQNGNVRINSTAGYHDLGTANIFNLNTVVTGFDGTNVTLSSISGAPFNIYSAAGQDLNLSAGTTGKTTINVASGTSGVQFGNGTGTGVVAYLGGTGIFTQKLGSALTISSNTIAPSNTIQHVGAGLIKTITVPGGMGGSAALGGVVWLVPDAAFTTDATGNIAVATTAVISKPMAMVYDPTTTKWYPSY